MNIGRFARRRPVPTALIVVAVAVVLGVLLNYKSNLSTFLRPGETITINLAQDYKLDPSQSFVKMAGVEIGNVESVGHPDSGPIPVKLKVRNGTRDLLGTEPTAVVRPTIILGGKYYVELSSGGQPGTFTGEIPVERTRLPVELDKVLSAFPPDNRAGLQGLTVQLTDTLKTSTPAFKQLLKDAPAPLVPAGVVLDGVRGVNKDTDLSQLVISANTATKVLSDTPGQLQNVVDSLATTSKAFGDNAGALSKTFADLPETMRATRVGSADLNTTLDKLIDTADDVRPSVRALDPLLKKLDPTLKDAKDLMHDLRPLVDDARPLTDELKPTINKGTDVLDDLSGDVLDRVKGPIVDALDREWKGSCPKYCNGGRDGAKLYEEIGYFFTQANGMTAYQTPAHHLVGFMVGGGSTTLLGNGTMAEKFERSLAELWGIPGTAPVGGSKGGTSNSPLGIPGTGQGFQIPLPSPFGHEPGFDPSNPQRGVR